MNITSPVFQAYLECPTKCFLRAHGEVGAGNEYANWVRTETESYRHRESDRLVIGIHPGECIRGLTNATDLKTAKCRLALDVLAQTGNQESEIHAVETVPSEGRGKATQFIPIRFVFRNKLTTNDKLLLAYDASVLSGMLGRSVPLGKIIHGDDHSILKVKTATLHNRVGKLIEKIGALLSTDKAPDLVLNRHCGECEFQTRCRQKAVEKDDLSLLSGMSEKERTKLNSKGIFTVTQLSYTFRPRRRPKKLRDKKEKYHHSLKALAIREKKIHIVGTPELKIEGTPVYIDVEGLPDRDFYYLIGMRIGEGESAVQHSLWADTADGEKRIWKEFLAILDGIEKPVLIHYGSYETTFLKRMCDRHGKPPVESSATRAISASLNILSVIFAHIYFPTHSNSLKAVAVWIGFAWPDASLSGANSISRRCAWESSHDSTKKNELVAYNAGDCGALELVVAAILGVCHSGVGATDAGPTTKGVVNTDSLETRPTMWPQFRSPIVEFNQINQAARWDYQRDRIYVKADNRIITRSRRQVLRSTGSARINRRIIYASPPECPQCGRRGSHSQRAKRSLYDIRFTRWGLKRWVARYEYDVFWCRSCAMTYGAPAAFWPGSKYGRDLVAYVNYSLIELCVPQRTITQSVNRFFGFNLADHTVNNFKARCAGAHTDTRNVILRRMLTGPVILADETQIGVRGKRNYVWVFTSLHDVIYVHSETREGDIVQKTLSGFKGVLVSDFYAPYDSMDCPQQKCLIHLIRDLNDELLAQPYDEELRALVNAFAGLLRPMIETVDRYGLKKHFLKKHVVAVDRFFRGLGKARFTSQAAQKCKVRFEKNRNKLFTFLEYDGVPWNNNNAEHAIKAFARLRRVIEGISTQKGIEQYLVLLSVCQTCKYRGLDFLDFLRSREKEIDVFAQSRSGRRRQVL
jgi:predicted RecB family nuclease